MSDEYFYSLEGKQHGPVSLLELRGLAARSTLKRTDKIWTDGMAAWIHAGSKPELFQGLPPDLVETPSEPRFSELPPLSDSPTAVTVERRRTPGLMAIISFFFPGVGQMLCGQKTKGTVLLAATLLGNIFSGGLVALFMCPFMAFDAFSIAKKCDRGLPVGEWEFCPTVPEINRIKPEVITAILIGLVLVAVLYVQHLRNEESRLKADRGVELLNRLMQSQ